MPEPVTSLALYKNLVVDAGYPAPRGGGGHLIRPLGFNEWIGVASSDFSVAGRPYYTNNNWETVTLTDTFTESTSSNIISAMLVDGTMVLIGTAEGTNPPDAGLATIERSTDTGQSYTLVQNIGRAEDPPDTQLGWSGNFRAYAIIKLSNGTYMAGCGSGSPEWWTSPDGLVWTQQPTQWVTWDAINELWPVRTIMALLEGDGGRIVALIRGSTGGPGSRHIYTIESFGTGAVVLAHDLGSSSFNGIGSLFRAASGTMFAIEGGIYRSTDNGDSWTLISGTSGALSGQMAEIEGTLCAPAGAGVLFSIDDGVTWTGVSGGGAVKVYEVHAGLDNKFYLPGYLVGSGSNNNPVILSTNEIVPPTAPAWFTLGALRRYEWTFGPLTLAHDAEARSAYRGLFTGDGTQRPIWVHKIPEDLGEIFICEWTESPRSRGITEMPERRFFDASFSELARTRADDT